jgi:SnoaL-like domain
MASLGSQGTAPVRTVLALYEAIRDSRIADVLALTDPDVACQPLVRPGLSVYYGHDGMAELVRDMHAAHGRYQVEIAEITENDGPQVTVQAVIVPEPGHGQPRPVSSVYAFRGSLITSIESSPTP